MILTRHWSAAVELLPDTSPLLSTLTRQWSLFIISQPYIPNAFCNKGSDDTGKTVRTRIIKTLQLKTFYVIFTQNYVILNRQKSIISYGRPLVALVLKCPLSLHAHGSARL